MPRATCRCGHALNIPGDGSERVVCPNCGAKVRVRLKPGVGTDTVLDGGYLRFNCPCGRRLKVSADASPRPSHGKCPDCGRVVPVPETSQASDPEATTQELSPADRAVLDEWSQRHVAGEARRPSSTHVLPTGTAPARSEAGLRVCPGCGRPVHMGASVCRACGIPVPKR